MLQSNQAIADQEIEKYIEEMKELYNNFLLFIENSDSNEISFNNMIDIINKQKLKENREEFEHFLRLIASIANNHHYIESFFNKILQIIQHYSTEIKQILSNIEIFHIFQNNKKFSFFFMKTKLSHLIPLFIMNFYIKQNLMVAVIVTFSILKSKNFLVKIK